MQPGLCHRQIPSVDTIDETLASLDPPPPFLKPATIESCTTPQSLHFASLHPKQADRTVRTVSQSDQPDCMDRAMVSLVGLQLRSSVSIMQMDPHILATSCKPVLERAVAGCLNGVVHSELLGGAAEAVNIPDAHRVAVVCSGQPAAVMSQLQAADTAETAAAETEPWCYFLSHAETAATPELSDRYIAGSFNTCSCAGNYMLVSVHANGLASQRLPSCSALREINTAQMRIPTRAGLLLLDDQRLRQDQQNRIR